MSAPGHLDLYSSAAVACLIRWKGLKGSCQDYFCQKKKKNRATLTTVPSKKTDFVLVLVFPRLFRAKHNNSP